MNVLAQPQNALATLIFRRFHALALSTLERLAEVAAWNHESTNPRFVIHRLPTWTPDPIPSRMNTRKGQTIRRVFLILNYLALLAAVAGLFFATVLAPMGDDSRVTTLDRAGVFNEPALRKFSPKMADNPRSEIAPFIAGPTRFSGILFATCFGTLALLNIFGGHALAGVAKTPNPIDL